MEGLSAGVLFGVALAGIAHDSTIPITLGGYFTADLVYQAKCELGNYMQGDSRLGACEQPASIAIEVAYRAYRSAIALLDKHR